MVWGVEPQSRSLRAAGCSRTGVGLTRAKYATSLPSADPSLGSFPGAQMRTGAPLEQVISPPKPSDDYFSLDFTS